MKVSEPWGKEVRQASRGLSAEGPGPLLLGPAHLYVGTPGPYTLQGLLGCELGPDNASVPVAKFALNGEDFMNFDPKLGTWNGEWPETETIRKTWTQQAGAVSKERTFLLNSCPQRLLGHLERGRGNLEWKGEHPPESLIPMELSVPMPPTVGLILFPGLLASTLPTAAPPRHVPEGLSRPRAVPAPFLHTALPWLSETSGHSSSSPAWPGGPEWQWPLSLSLASACLAQPEFLEPTPALPFLHLRPSPLGPLVSQPRRFSCGPGGFTLASFGPPRCLA